MAVFDSLRKGVVSRRWGSLVAAGLLSFTLYGCGSSDSTPPPPPPPPPPVGIDVAAVIAAAAANPANDSSTNMQSAFAGLDGTGLAKVTINSAPVVKFSVFSDGQVVKSGVSASLMLSKLVPGANGSPDKWVNYIWADDAGTWGAVDCVFDADGNCVGTPVITDQTKARQGTNDSGGTLVYDANGYYTYTFGNDITDSTRANAKDSSGQPVVYEAGRTHRLSLQLSYRNAAGALVRVNPYYHFTIGGDGKSIDAANPRQIVDIRSCNSCHEKLELHGGSRNDVTICVQCHQPGAIDKGTGETIDMMNLVHKIHAGEALTKPYYFYRFRSSTEFFWDFSEVGFPQDIRNCTKCHNGDASSDPLVAVQTAQGNNWYNKPSRVACGTCHDGINFATSTGTTLSGDPNVHTSGTFPLADDSACVLCHGADKGLAVKLVHATNFATANNPLLPDGVAKFSFDLSSVKVNADGTVTYRFRINKDGSPVTLDLTPGAQPVAGYTSGASFYMGYAVPTDGIAKPADFTSRASRSLTQAITDGGVVADTDGYYLATVTLGGTQLVPADATMATGMFYGYFTNPGGVRSVAMLKKMTAKDSAGTNYTARRVIVDSAKCNACHDQLGTSPNFHSGSYNDATACAICHKPNQGSSAWSADSATHVHGIHAAAVRSVPFNWHLGGGFDATKILYPGNIGNCSACHLDNTINFGTSASAAASTNLQPVVTAKGIYAASASLSPYVTIGTDYGTGISTSTGLAPVDGTHVNNLVSSKITSACVACHDDALAISHIRAQGGSFYEVRSVANTKQPEACLLCHGPGKIADIKVMHGQ